MELDGLFAGLGNPGPEYAHTRHNFGFMLADMLLEDCRAKGRCDQLSGGKGRYEAFKCRLPGKNGGTWLVVKPLTFMNRSGEAVLPLLRYYRVPLENLLVAHDELDIPFGRLRIKIGGGSAGHKGIDSIAEVAGSKEFYRLRLGIGKPAGYDTVSFVLGRFGAEENEHMETILNAALKGFYTFAREGFTPAQRRINAFALPKKENSAGE
ncbi:aminoacyl-tRNA hydrolase [Desulfovibrio sp. OttesenSCG-928-I05]|nr:aminoacyl-tRNA hydrolase [Desulfovibrio sp. OttesenSCG-928-I05]